MTPDDIELARELVALECWEWPTVPADSQLVPPQLPCRTGVELDGEWFWLDDVPHSRLPDTEACIRVGNAAIRIPDITHALTKGWLLHIARKVLDANVYAQKVGLLWGVMRPGKGVHPSGCIAQATTEHAALVAAIKAEVEG